MKMILDHGLAVIIDMHPESDFKAKLVQHDDFVEQFSDFWRALARHYSTYDPEKVFFEVLNEPEFRDRYRWAGVQAKLAAAIREGAPQHTIIAAGANWSDIDDLLSLTPLPDPNVIYNFHFYDPHVFTHQGATWGVNYWHFESKLGYRASMETAQRVASAEPDPPNRLAVLRYGLDHWDANRMAVEIGEASAWAKRWNVALTCNEFGAYRKVVDPEDRARWLRDVCARPVEVARDGDKAEPGRVYFAPDGRDLELARGEDPVVDDVGRSRSGACVGRVALGTGGSWLALRTPAGQGRKQSDEDGASARSEHSATRNGCCPHGFLRNFPSNPRKECAPDIRLSFRVVTGCRQEAGSQDLRSRGTHDAKGRVVLPRRIGASVTDRLCGLLARSKCARARPALPAAASARGSAPRTLQRSSRAPSTRTAYLYPAPKS